MDFRVFSRNISENMHARCVREDTKQALKGNLQADGVQSRQTLFVRYCPWTFAASPQKSRCPVKLTGQRLCFFRGNTTENLQADCVQSRQAGFVRCCLGNMWIILQLPACPESQTSAVHPRHALPAFRRRSPPAWEYWTHRKTVPVPFVRPHSLCRP